MQEFDFITVGSVEEACRTLAASGAHPIAGGTDVIPQLQRNRYPATVLVDITRLDSLRFIREGAERIEIGALTNYSAMLKAELLQQETPSLIEAVWTVGCPQTRYRGTLGGNIANASPAGDTLPPLLTFDADVHLVSAHGQRKVALADFLLGPGKTALEPGELLHSVSFPRLPPHSGTSFIKLGNRRGMNIAVASVAVAVTLGQGGRIERVRIAFGSLAATPRYSPQAEAVLTGEVATPTLYAAAAQTAQADISPIGDVRASADYRRHAAAQLLQRALQTAVARAGRSVTA